VCAEHGSLKKGRTKKEKGEIESKTALVNAAHDHMKMVCFARALAGGTSSFDSKTQQLINTDEAEILIINDNAQGKWQVFFVSDLIRLVIETTIDELKK
jgi:hypothetical protein